MTRLSLADLELDPRSHFAIHLHAGVLLVVDHLRRIGRGADLRAVLARHRFLKSYLDATMSFLPAELGWEETHGWWASAIDEWTVADRPSLPLCRLADGLELDELACSQLLVAGLVDEDSRFGEVFAELNGRPVRWPTFETLATVSAPIAERSGPDPVAMVLRLIEEGLLLALESDGPRSDWVVRPLPELWEVVRGGGTRAAFHRPAAELPDLDGLVSTTEFLDRCTRVSAGLADIDLLVVRGTAGSDRSAFAEAVCGTAGLGVVRVDDSGPTDACARFGPVATALGAALLVERDLPPGETLAIARRGYRGPVVAVLGATGGIDGKGHARTVSLEVPRLDVDARACRWRVALGGGEGADLTAIAEACGLQGRHIDLVAGSAAAMARLDDAPQVDVRHVRAAAGDLHRQLLDDLAARLEVAGSWDDVVVGDFTAAKLVELETRCRHRERIGGSLAAAYGRGTGIGVRSLFVGASGTGKTLAATVLGSRLGLDVHRLDLSAVVSKYVGETEKNLHRVLSTAEELDVVLLIDEGDSLLGRRTDVRSSNDRFANLETNYLLQLLEHYRGIVVVTTNAPDHVDVAFQRRMDVVVNFLPPSPRERIDIWRLHLPPGHCVSGELVTDLSQRCTMTGGQIRNAVLHAVLLAMHAEQPVGDEHVEGAVASEYQKAGASSPYDPSGRRRSVSQARSFQEVVT